MHATPLELSTLGHRIRHQRVSHGMTLDELGEKVGVAGSHLSLIENGKREPKLSLLQAIAACRDEGKYVGICGQGPSDYPDLARWLMEQGIDSISLNPDTVVDTWLFLAGIEV